ARAEMAAVDVRLAAEDPAENKGRRTRLSALHERVVGETRTALLVLFGAVGLVLLISCANFANLLLTRAAAREQEIVVRAALGAGRGRLVCQLLTESLLLALVGGTAGLVLALWGVDLLLALKPDDLPRLDEIRVDGRVLLFTLGVSVLTGLIFGLVPAWQMARTDLNAALKEGGRSTTAGASRQRMRGALVVAELALALVLLIGAGLLIKSFWGLRAVAPGFATENLQTMRVELPEARYRQIPAQVRFRQQALEAVNSLPGVRAAMVSELPLTGDYLTHNFVIEGRPLPPGDEPEIQTLTLSGDYFGVMNIPLLRGRDLTPQDREGAPYVCLVNESMVRQYFPDEDPLGKRIRWARGDSPWMTIVGVVADARHQGLDQPAEPAVYDSYAQTVQPWKRWMYLAVRSSEDPARIAAAVKRQVWTVDARLPVTRVRTMAEVASASLAGRQFVMLLLLIFAGVALLLAAVGIYGVIAYAVALRTHEIGVRMALGAGPRDVLALVLRQGLALTAAGVALGLAASLALTRIMVSLLYGVGATDPTTFGAIAVVLALVALLACYVPARRATKVDPVVALRQ
ncbi:MAG TPA: ABC transporter permease, partial [Blastocatellia bacterium]|nr:ABC transporter permease [Blastocatellia bacterium]